MALGEYLAISDIPLRTASNLQLVHESGLARKAACLPNMARCLAVSSANARDTIICGEISARRSVPTCRYADGIAVRTSGCHPTEGKYCAKRKVRCTPLDPVYGGNWNEIIRMRFTTCLPSLHRNRRGPYPLSRGKVIGRTSYQRQGKGLTLYAFALVAFRHTSQGQRGPEIGESPKDRHKNRRMMHI